MILLFPAPPAPKNLRSTTVASKSAKVQWDPIPSFGGQLKSHILQIYESGQEATTMRKIPNVPVSYTADQIIRGKYLRKYV